MLFRNGANKKAGDKGAEMKKAYDDYKSGKMSADEYTKKLMELQQELTESLPKSAITVGEGFQSKITNGGNPTDPESIDPSEIHWWDGADFQ
jgi:hypothetical protein